MQLTWKSGSPTATGEALSWIIPNLQEPKNKREIKRAAKGLAEFKVDASPDQITESLGNGALVDLDDETWKGIVNTTSLKCEKLRDVLKMAKEEQKKVRHIIVEFIDSQVNAPIVLCLPGETEDNDQYYLINGNTRLSICKVFNMRPKVWLADLKAKEGGKSLLAAPFRTKGIQARELPTGVPIEKLLIHWFKAQEKEVLDWIQHPEWWEKTLATQGLEVLNPDKWYKSGRPDQQRDEQGRWSKYGREMFNRVNEDGGFTIDPRFKDTPTEGYSVCVFPEREKRYKAEEMKPSLYEKYVKDNEDILRTVPGTMPGGWLDEEKGLVCLDIVKVYNDRDAAHMVAILFEQDGYYDFAGKRTVRTDAHKSIGANDRDFLNSETPAEKIDPLLFQAWMRLRRTGPDREGYLRGQGSDVDQKSLWMILPAIMLALRHWTNRMAASFKPIIHDYVYESAAETWQRLFPHAPAPHIPPIMPAVLDDIPPDITTPFPEHRPEPHTPAVEPVTPPPITQAPVETPVKPPGLPQIFRPPAEPVPETRPATPPKPPEKPPEKPNAAPPEKPRVSIDFTVVNPHLDKAIASLPLKFCQETNETTSKDLQSALDQLRQEFKEGMIEEGETVNELTKRVKKVFEHAETWRAKRIAQTEASRAIHIAQLEAAKQSGIVKAKKWIASSNACPGCLKLASDYPNGIPLDENFTVVESTKPEYRNIQHPPLHPHCRCAIFEVIDESQLEPGRIIQ